MIARRQLAIHKVPAHIVLLTALASYAAQVLAVILHFLYNLIETMPLVAAFAYQANRIYNEWLPHAFPDLPEPLLIETTDRLQTMWFRPGEVIVREGDVADRLYIVSTGEVEVLRWDEASDTEAQMTHLGPGSYFGEIGLLAGTPRTATVRAKIAAEVLAIDRETFEHIVGSSAPTAEALSKIAMARAR